MTENDKREINEYLKELEHVLNKYSMQGRMRDVFVLVAFLAVWLVLTIAIGFWGTLLVVAIYFPVSKGMENKEERNQERELAMRACSMMDKCLKVLDYSNDERSRSAIMEISSVHLKGGNVDLYNRFVARFPNMRSLKLKTLSKIEIGYDNVELV